MIQKIPMADVDQRQKRFSEYSVDEQLDIYLYAADYFEGGSDDFLRYAAFEGEKKIPVILKRIDEDDGEDPRLRTRLISLLDLIDLRCHCLARVEGALKTLSRNRMVIRETDIAGFRDFKKLYDDILDRILLRSSRL